MILSKQQIHVLSEMACQIAVPQWMKVSVQTPSDCETPYHRFLYLLAKEFAPCEIVELGTREGIAAMSMAEGNPSGGVYTLDIQDQRHSECKRTNIFFFNQHSLSCPIEIPTNLDIVFIDTIHDGDLPRREFEHWHKFVRRGGIIIFDDIELNDQMKSFWENLNPEGYEKMSLPELHTSGFGLLIKHSDK